ncbi:hypothetical protein [Azospirillum sp. sgz301742]
MDWLIAVYNDALNKTAWEWAGLLFTIFGCLGSFAMVIKWVRMWIARKAAIKSVRALKKKIAVFIKKKDFVSFSERHPFGAMAEIIRLASGVALFACIAIVLSQRDFVPYPFNLLFGFAGLLFCMDLMNKCAIKSIDIQGGMKEVDALAREIQKALDELVSKSQYLPATARKRLEGLKVLWESVGSLSATPNASLELDGTSSGGRNATLPVGKKSAPMELADQEAQD